MSFSKKSLLDFRSKMRPETGLLFFDLRGKIKNKYLLEVDDILDM